VLFLTYTEGKARTLLNALSKRYQTATVAFHDNRDFFVWTSDYGKEEHVKRPIPRTNKYFQWLWVWPAMMFIALRMSRTHRYDVCVSEGEIPTLVAVIARVTGRIRKVVYYALDWFVGQKWAQRLDWLCFAIGSARWDLTPRISEARQQRWGWPTSRGVLLQPFPHSARDQALIQSVQVEKAVCYTGGIRRSAGLDMVIQAIGILRRGGLDIRFRVCGWVVEREYEESLKLLAREECVADLVTFHGHVSEEEKELIIRKSMCGIALSPRGAENYSNYAYIGKVSDYCDNGTPIILTKDSYVASLLSPKNAAIAVGDSYAEVADAIRSLATDTERLALCKRMAYQYGVECSSPEGLYRRIEKLL